MRKNKTPPLVRGLDQCKSPTGVEGRAVAGWMNKGHFDLTTWGLKHVKIEPDFVVLDLGCGGGKTLSRLARRVTLGKVYGIDVSWDMVEYSRQVNLKLVKENRIEIIQTSVEATVFRDEFFDLVTAIETYYFWPNLYKAFREIKQILKPRGKLIIISEMIKDGIFEVKHASTIAKTQVKLLPLQEMQLILSSCGFVNVQTFRKRSSDWNVIVAQKP